MTNVSDYKKPPQPLGNRPQPLCPLGVSILAWLHLIGGVFISISAYGVIKKASEMQSIGISPAFLFVSIVFLAAITIGSAIGMLMGEKWGWWLATFYYVYSIFRSASAMYMAIILSDQMETGDRGIEYYLVKYGGRIVVSSFIILYFSRDKVLQYFDLEGIAKRKAISIHVGICSAISVFGTVLSFLLN